MQVSVITSYSIHYTKLYDAYPSEVWRGKKMPGRFGNKNVTVKNLKIVKIIAEKNIVLISGAIPGTRNSLIKVAEK